MTMLEVLVGNLLLYLFMARCYGNSSKMSLVYILSIYYVIISLSLIPQHFDLTLFISS